MRKAFGHRSGCYRDKSQFSRNIIISCHAMTGQIKTLKVASHNCGSQGLQDNHLLDLIPDFDVVLLQEVHEDTLEFEKSAKWTSYFNRSEENYGGTALLIRDKVRGLDLRNLAPVQPCNNYRRFYVTMEDKLWPDDLFTCLTSDEEADVNEAKMYRSHLFKYGMVQRLRAKINGIQLELWNINVLPYGASSKNGETICKALIKLFSESFQSYDQDTIICLIGHWNAVQSPLDRKKDGTYGTFWVDDEMTKMWTFFQKAGMKDPFIPKTNFDGTHAASRANYSYWNAESHSHCRIDHVHANDKACDLIKNMKHTFYKSLGSHAVMTFEIEIPGSEDWAEEERPTYDSPEDKMETGVKSTLGERIRNMKIFSFFRSKDLPLGRGRSASTGDLPNKSRKPVKRKKDAKGKKRSSSVNVWQKVDGVKATKSSTSSTSPLLGRKNRTHSDPLQKNINVSKVKAIKVKSQDNATENGQPRTFWASMADRLHIEPNVNEDQVQKDTEKKGKHLHVQVDEMDSTMANSDKSDKSKASRITQSTTLTQKTHSFIAQTVPNRQPKQMFKYGPWKP